ncbi:MAG: outer membrane beta-barrel protein [Chitinophagales bacterium]|nr:outer membrane beta-barrel protein [Chitinophagales bacterium]
MQFRRLLPVLVLLLSQSLVQAQIDYPEDAFRELRRGLDGTWFMPTDRGDRLEIWWKENDSTMVGKSIRIKPENGDSVLLERLRLELRDTTITYIVTARNQNSGQPVPFVLTEIDDEGFFVFSNPKHDDPQKIRYLLLGNREMQVETIGKRNGREVKTEYVFEREFTPGAVEFRARAGINAHNLRSTGSLLPALPDQPTFGWQPGWEAGVQARFKGRGGFITINTEISAIGRRAHAQSAFTVYPDTTQIDYKRDLNYHSVWLVASIMPEITFRRDGRLSLIAGPYYGRLVGLNGKGVQEPTEENKLFKVNNDFKKNEFGINLGFQYKLNFGKKDLGGILGLRASYGLNNIDNLYFRYCDYNPALCNGQLSFLGASLYYSVNLLKI